ncbi:MAG: hypothetical protein COW65_17145 [Cytophagales bacterium CG18_big_fil_WC_8_21_14_2_50_42_9]|nr:MAG: hypothetical protein COW65_17145 [Cytophagales bacterium CG18_big_fil_WC_8_21_14_2_50_42_9]
MKFQGVLLFGFNSIRAEIAAQDYWLALNGNLLFTILTLFSDKVLARLANLKANIGIVPGQCYKRHYYVYSTHKAE